MISKYFIAKIIKTYIIKAVASACIRLHRNVRLSLLVCQVMSFSRVPSRSLVQALEKVEVLPAWGVQGCGVCMGLRV